MGTHYQGNKSDELTLTAFITLTRASDSIHRRLTPHITEAGLTESQFGVMEALYHLGPLNQKALAKKLLKSGGNITMVIDNLEKCSFVERKQDSSDRRSMLIHLTAKGKTFIHSFFPKQLQRIRKEFEVLSENEKKELIRLCKKVGLKE